MKRIKFRTWINVALVAAIYVVLTLVLAPLSYGAIQFRISEMLMILVLYNPIYSISLVVGCLIANFASPMALLDVGFGTPATLISVIIMIFIKNKTLASLVPSIANGLIIALELKIAYDLPFWLSMVEVFIGEFVVVSIIGLFLFKSVEKNEVIVSSLEMKVDYKESKIDKYITPKSLFMLAAMVIGMILFFKLGLYYIHLEDNDITIALFNYTFGLDTNRVYPFFIIGLIIPILIFASSFIFKWLLGLIIDLVFISIGIAITIISIVLIKENIDFYYYAYFGYYIIIGTISYYSFSINMSRIEIEKN